MNAKELAEAGTVYNLILYLVVAQTIVTLKEYDLEHKNNINLRASCRSLAVFLDQHFLKCGTEHLKVNQGSEPLKRIAHLGESIDCKFLLEQVFTHRLAVYYNIMQPDLNIRLQSLTSTISPV